MKKWHTRNSKLEYRKHLISIVRKQLGKDSLPIEKQYWTICGKCHDDGKPQNGTEFGQLLLENFISPNQFVGIDTVEDIIEGNRKAYPQAEWICGKFEDTIIDATYEDGFNPGVVHLDYHNEPPQVIPWTIMVLNELAHAGKPCIVIANMVTSHMNIEDKEYQLDDIEQLMQNSRQYQRLLQQGRIARLSSGIDTLPKPNGRMTALLWEVKSA